MVQTGSCVVTLLLLHIFLFDIVVLFSLPSFLMKEKRDNEEKVNLNMVLSRN
jgi:hypothetical protein